MKTDIDLKATLKVGLSVAMLTASAGMQAFEVDRTHLPIAEPDPPKFKELDVRNVETPPKCFVVKVSLWISSQATTTCTTKTLMSCAL